MCIRDRFSPRANVRFNPTDNINLRASYSFGFRAPQAFDEDLHIDNVGDVYKRQGTYAEGAMAEFMKHAQPAIVTKDAY